MFMKPIGNSKFDVWDPENVVLFYKEAPVGKNKVAITQEETELTELFTDWRGCEFLLLDFGPWVNCPSVGRNVC